MFDIELDEGEPSKRKLRLPYNKSSKLQSPRTRNWSQKWNLARQH